MTPFTRSLIVPLTLLLALGEAEAAVQFANFQTGSFIPSASPGYLAPSKTESVSVGDLGSFSTSISTTGTGWAVGGPPTGVVIQESWVEPAYAGQFPGLTALGFLGAAGSTVTIQFDFSTLAGGFLPAGSIIAYNDIDGTEQATFNTGVASWYSTSPATFYQVGANVGGPWGTGQPAPTAADAPLTTGSDASTLVLTGPGAVTDGVTNFIVTLVDITSLTITANGSSGAQFANSVAIGAIPEPTSALLLGTAGAMCLLGRRRDFANSSRR